MGNENQTPETAVVGLRYWDSGSKSLLWAEWVNRKSWVLAKGDWSERLELIQKFVGWRELDAIAASGLGTQELSTDCTGRGGKLTLEGTLAAYKLATERAAAKESKATAPVSALAMAEIAEACEAEGTPLRSNRGRPDRTCVECGSAVYGDFCTHCHEG